MSRPSRNPKNCVLSTVRQLTVILVASLSLTLVATPGRTATEQAEADTTATRPRIGLVLSGGGARGAAHIGVLAVLEELRVPVDAIAGTSMGSIVGGLYAAGLSPAEMRDDINEIDWSSIFADAPPRQDLSFRRKEDQYDPLFAVEIGFRGGHLMLPSGLVAGQKLDFTLRSLVLDTYLVTDFDRLAIPYRAVATDLADGSVVVLAGGDLVQAMRASMAIPGAFTPMEIDGRVLVDGAVCQNLPVATARTMNVDRLIAVNIGTPVSELHSDPTLLGVVTRTLDLLSKANVPEQKALLGTDDLLIEPELGDISSASFDRLPEAVAMGEAAAREMEAELRQFSVSPQEYAAFLARQRRQPAPAPMIDKIEVTGNDRVPTTMIEDRIETAPGEPLDLALLGHDLMEIYRIGEFSRVSARLERSDESTNLVIGAAEKFWGPGYLRLGLLLASDLNGAGAFTLYANYRQSFVNRLGAEWRTVLRLGNIVGVLTDFYQPLTYSGLWFVNPAVDWARFRRDIYLSGVARLPIEEHNLEGRFDAGLSLGHLGELRVGVYRGILRVKERISVESDPEKVDRGGWRARLVHDRLDNLDFPTTGTFVEIDALLSRPGLGADGAYDQLDLRLSRAFSGGRTSFLLRGRLVSDLGSDIPFYDQAWLGGFGQISGLKPGEIQDDNLALGAMTVYYRLNRLSPIIGKAVYLGASIETGGAWPTLSQATVDDLRLGATAFLGLDTVFGPFYLGWGWVDRGSNSAYLMLGRVY
jgi:NTE family protein